MTKNQIIESKKREILSLARRHGARKIRLFGSVARGESDERSDFDFLVDMEPDRSLLDHVALVQDLEELLGSKVDVVSERALHWYLRDRVLQEAIPL